MSVSVLEIVGQKLSSVISSYYYCEACGYVSSNPEMVIANRPCEHCGVPIRRGVMFFKMGIHSMIDLMQEFYHFQPAASPLSYVRGTNGENHRLAVILFYCSLGDLLFENFLEYYLFRLAIPPNIQDELLKDIAIDKRLGLFRTLTSTKFSQAIKDLDESQNNTYQRVVDFYLEVREKRNHFLHAGNFFNIDKDMPQQCLSDAPILIAIFVLLHNKFIVKS
jgi:hypothetical protein